MVFFQDTLLELKIKLCLPVQVRDHSPATLQSILSMKPNISQTTSNGNPVSFLVCRMSCVSAQDPFTCFGITSYPRGTRFHLRRIVCSSSTRLTAVSGIPDIGLVAYIERPPLDKNLRSKLQAFLRVYLVASIPLFWDTRLCCLQGAGHCPPTDTNS